jgi:hypothetical protein
MPGDSPDHSKLPEGRTSRDGLAAIASLAWPDEAGRGGACSARARRAASRGRRVARRRRRQVHSRAGRGFNATVTVSQIAKLGIIVPRQFRKFPFSIMQNSCIVKIVISIYSDHRNSMCHSDHNNVSTSVDRTPLSFAAGASLGNFHSARRAPGNSSNVAMNSADLERFEQ